MYQELLLSMNIQDALPETYLSSMGESYSDFELSLAFFACLRFRFLRVFVFVSFFFRVFFSLAFSWGLFLLVSWVRWVKGFGVQNGGLVCCHYHKWALQNGIHHLDFLGFSDGFHFARCFANWRPGKVNGAHEIAWSGPLILYGIVFVIQIYGGCHSVHDISFSLIRHPILYQCLFRFLVVALILQQIYVQDGY